MFNINNTKIRRRLLGGARSVGLNFNPVNWKEKGNTPSGLILMEVNNGYPGSE